MHHCSNENIDTFRLGADEGAKEKALTELIDKCLLFLVDEAGFEPATFGFGGPILVFTWFSHDIPYDHIFNYLLYTSCLLTFHILLDYIQRRLEIGLEMEQTEVGNEPACKGGRVPWS